MYTQGSKFLRVLILVHLHCETQFYTDLRVIHADLHRLMCFMRLMRQKSSIGPYGLASSRLSGAHRALSRRRLPFVEERQREVHEKEFRTAHQDRWDKEKPQYLVFHSCELIMHAFVGGWFSGVFPG